MRKRVSPLGEQIQRLMRREGIEKQKDLADQSGVSQSTISRIVLGDDDNPGIQQLAKLAKALNASVGEIIAERDKGGELPEPVVYFQRYYDVDHDTARTMQNVIEVLIDAGKLLRRHRAS